jgi:NAD(P)H dehydrogenase (quinone)
MTASSPTLFVAGAGGKVGRRVVELLLTRGYNGKIIAGSRRPEALNFPGVEVRKADYGDLAGFTAALNGVDRVLIVSTDVIGDARQKLQTSAVAAAKAAGVKHIVYTSLPHPEPGNAALLAADHHLTEEAIKATGIEYTFLRNSWYTENLLGALPPAIASGKWFSASGAGTMSHVTREDTARAAAGALIADHVGSRVLTVSGPAALSTHQIAVIASEIVGKTIEVVDVSDEQFVEGLKQAGLPPDVASLLASFQKAQRQGSLSMVTNAVEELWGEGPVSVRDFLVANRAALVMAA